MTDHTTEDAVARLRLVLRANATFSFTCGVVALVAGAWLSRELGIGHVLLTRLLGGGLILFAVAVMVISRLDEQRLRAEAALVAVADVAWVVGSVAILLTGWSTTTGNVIVALVALAVADFGTTQLWYRAKVADDAAEMPAATI